MGRTGRRMVGGMLVALLAALLLFSSGVAAAGLTTGTGSGGSYVSATYGYMVGWDAPWTATEQTVDAQGRDLLQLQDGVGTVVVAGVATTRTDARQCLVDEARADARMNGVYDLAVLKDGQTGKPIVDGNAAEAAAVFRFTATANDGTAQSMGMLLDCHIAGQTEILVTAVAPSSQFGDELPAFVTIAHGIAVNPSATQRVGRG